MKEPKFDVQFCLHSCHVSRFEQHASRALGQIWPRPTIYTAMSHSSSRRSSLIWNRQWTFKRRLQDRTVHNGPSQKQNEGPIFHMQTRRVWLWAEIFAAKGSSNYPAYLFTKGWPPISIFLWHSLPSLDSSKNPKQAAQIFQPPWVCWGLNSAGSCCFITF